MCGVCGIVRPAGGLAQEGARRSVELMMDALRHRGPEGSGVAGDPHAAFAATRLAIRGLVDGRQPLCDPASGVIVVCNGEIDNHRELRHWLRRRGRGVTSSTDVAVIPGLYLELGEDFVERLVGAFALAVWDPRDGRLLLARDRAGERPLFYTQESGQITFATELAAFAADPGRRLILDQDALRGYLQYGDFVAPSTPFAGIRKVGPAELVSFRTAAPGGGAQPTRRRYWRWPIGSAPKVVPDAAAFDGIFRAAVARQSETDVEHGVFLSGGIDSSLVAAVAKDLRPDAVPPAYTIRFGEPSYDEGAMATRVARHLGLELTQIWVRPEDFPDEIGRLVRLVGEPLGDPAWVPTALLVRRAGQDVKMALVGEGGDELFGGYPTYLGARMADRYARLPAGVRRLVSAAVGRWPPTDKKVAISFLLRRFVEGAEMDGLERHRLWTSRVPPAILLQLGVRPLEPPAEPAEAARLLDAVQRIDLETSLAEGLLTKSDRASMSWPLELRAPFLDAGVMEFAARLPERERVRGLRTKTFLKRYAGRYLPRAVVHQRKRGLSVPLAAWLRGPLYEWSCDLLSTGVLGAVGVETRPALDLLESHVARVADHGRALWNLLALAEWLRSMSEREVRSQ